MTDIHVGDAVRTCGEGLVGTAVQVDTWAECVLVEAVYTCMWYGESSLERACRSCGRWPTEHTLKERKCLFGPTTWT